MAFVTADRVRDTSTTAGSGSFLVSGTAPTGYRTFSAVLSVSDTFYYSIQHQTLNEWEVGLGTYSSANTFSRTTIYSSSNAGSAVTFSAGTKDVFITMAAARSPQLDASGNVAALGTPTSVNLTNATDLPLASGVSGTLPTANGGLGASVSPTTAGNVLFTADGSVWSSTQKIVRGTLVTLTTQTAVDFTSIPSWVKRITITLVGASLSGTANILFQLGTGGTPTTSGYLGSSSSALFASTVATINVSTGIPAYLGTATYSLAGSVVFVNPTSNTWIGNGNFGLGGVVGTVTSTGRIALGGVLNMVRITSTNGTDTLDAGSVNIFYE